MGLAAPAKRVVVTVGPGTWRFGPLDSVIVPDGVHLRGAGVGKTVFEWPTQTGAICLARKADRIKHGSGPDPSPGLVSSSVQTRRPQSQTLGWGLSDPSIEVLGGFQQNDTKAHCPGIVPCNYELRG